MPMNHTYLLFCLLGISVYCLVSIVAHEAIIGGTRALPSEIRYQATILIAYHAPRCGGGIIDRRTILTAAHCVIERNNELVVDRPISVLVGTHNLSIPGQVFQVEKISVPVEYNPQVSHPIGDLAVLELKEPYMQMDLAKVFALNFPKLTSVYVNKSARIAGFGWNKMFGNSMIGENTDNELRFIDTIVRSDDQCMRDHPNANLSDSHLCARAKQFYYEDCAVCIGDAGGPLTLHGKTIIGILSVITSHCSEKNSSGIYTRIAHYRQWIVRAMGSVSDPKIRVFKV